MHLGNFFSPKNSLKDDERSSGRKGLLKQRMTIMPKAMGRKVD